MPRRNLVSFRISRIDLKNRDTRFRRCTKLGAIFYRKRHEARQELRTRHGLIQEIRAKHEAKPSIISRNLAVIARCDSARSRVTILRLASCFVSRVRGTIFHMVLTGFRTIQLVAQSYENEMTLKVLECSTEPGNHVHDSTYVA